MMRLANLKLVSFDNDGEERGKSRSIYITWKVSANVWEICRRLTPDRAKGDAALFSPWSHLIQVESGVGRGGGRPCLIHRGGPDAWRPLGLHFRGDKRGLV